MGLWDTATKAVSDTAQKTTSAITTATTTARDAVTTATTKVADVGQKKVAKAVDTGEEVSQYMADETADVVKTITEPAVNAGSKVADQTKDAIETARSEAVTMKDSVAGGIEVAGNRLGVISTGIHDTIVDGTAQLKDVVTTATETAQEGYDKVVGNKLDSIGQFVKDKTVGPLVWIKENGKYFLIVGGIILVIVVFAYGMMMVREVKMVGSELQKSFKDGIKVIK